MVGTEGRSGSMTSKQRVACAIAAAVCGVALARSRRASRAIDFAGKSVLIFGGSRGLGLVLARELAAEGAHVTLAARSQEELARALADLIGRGLWATTVKCDVRSRSDVEA